MNEIKVSVNFKTGECRAYDYEPINNDYNVSKLVFNFDEEYTGRKVVEIRPVGDDKNATFSSEIIDNEVVLVKEENGQNKSIFTKAGQHVIEVHLYNDGSKITATGTRPFNVKEEQINIGDSQATVYLPVFEQMIQELNTGLDNLSSGLNNLNNAITETNNLDLDVSKTDKEATVTIRKKDNTTKSITLSDGTSLMFHWRGTYLGIKTDKDDEYTYVNLQGIQGEKGETGAPFRIKKTYANIQLMIADYDNMQVDDHVMISGNVEQEDNAKLFTKTETEDPIYRWQYLGDFSGATGIQGETGLTPNIQIGSVVSGDSPSVTRTGTNENPILNFVLQKGEKGDTGNTGATGETGNGIVSIIKTSTEGLVDTYTITYTDGTTSTFDVTNGEDGEVTQTQFDKLQHRVEDLETNQLTDTKTGTNISIDDAHETEIVEGRLSKESTQGTTTGKNKYNINDLSKNNCTYVINDNSIVITATGTYGYIEQKIDNLDITKQYRLSFNGDNAAWITILNDAKVKIDEIYGSKARNFTPTTSTIYIRIYASTSSTSVTKTFTEIQLEEGSTTTEYEPYTGGIASPNPDYPQEIKTVKGYRNLFDKENVDWYRNNSSNFSATTNTMTDRIRTNSFEIQGGKTYVVSGIPNNISLVGVRTYSEYNGSITSDATRDGNVFTIGPNTKYIHLLFGGSDFTNETNELMKNANIQIVEGEQELPYVPYGTNWIYKKIIGKNEFDGEIELGSLSATGTPTSTNNSVITKNFQRVKPNTAYKISNDKGYQANVKFYDINKNYLSNASGNTGTFTTTNDTYFVKWRSSELNIENDVTVKYQLEQGTQATSYESYKENIVTLPLRDNEIIETDDYKDEYIIDKSGHCWLHKELNKKTIDGSESTSDYAYYPNERWNVRLIIRDMKIATNTVWRMSAGIMSTHFKKYYWGDSSVNANGKMTTLNTFRWVSFGMSSITTLNEWREWASENKPELIYPLETPQLIDLNYDVDVRLFNGVNNISNSDDMDMTIKYVQDINLYMSSIKNAILEIGGE